MVFLMVGLFSGAISECWNGVSFGSINPIVWCRGTTSHGGNSGLGSKNTVEYSNGFSCGDPSDSLSGIAGVGCRGSIMMSCFF